MLDRLIDFVYKYYVSPIIHDSGYNPVNTLTWGIILVLSLFGVLRLLDKLDVDIDKRLIYSLIPFIYVGSSLRVVEDAEILSAPLSYILITPLIYFLIALLVILALLVGYFLNKKFGSDKKKIVLFSGLIYSVITSVLLINFGLKNPVNLSVPLKVISYSLIVFTPIFLAEDLLHISNLLSEKIYILIFYVHVFDASSTFVGYGLGATEKHVVPSFFINLTGTAAVMYPLKISIIFFTIYIVDSVFREGEDLGVLTLLALLVLGLAPGLRNTLRLTLGV